ncbi:hypothetical protein GCM10025868_08260 [Angustibacter aerolatus]|uniref:HTH asnC-type domain-containing protein n=1 Tax=Angustibacter aerolatus TaxID=1162965 RepID=A0ABQ6JDD4_9ACTN|nr:aminotransferase class III-fold pyridoxal phosphate-dependent enzyme [Angustibacter aerolatus]GMA85576.1 hypothetical protein GCM10025868_08260 [Angustibacter aerolatus]
MTTRDRSSYVLDDLSKRIIEQAQEDGRRPYAQIGKAVGLSEAAVRQRVQRLLDAGVMQIVAVTDPLQVGFSRQAMIGIRCEGDLTAVADEPVRHGRGRLRRHHRRRFDLLAEAVCEDDDALLDLISTRIRTIKGVTSTETFVYLKPAQAGSTTGEPDDHHAAGDSCRTAGHHHAEGHRAHRRRARPPLDALHPPLDVRGGRAGARHRARRGPPHLGRRGQGVHRRPGGPVHRAGRPRPHRARRGGREAGQGPGVLPAVVLRAPGGDRPRRAAGPRGARRPQPRLLHDRRRRGRRDRVEARQAVLQDDRQAHQAQGDQPRGGLPRHPAGALSITGIPEAKMPFEPLVPGAHKVPNTNLYRAPEALREDPKAFGRWAADRIAEAIEFEGADSVAAVFLEPVQNSGGCFPPPPGYFERVREICDEYDVLLVADETICAFGRIGEIFACKDFGFVPDMITCAKGMTSGYSPIGAMIASDRLFEPFKSGHASFAHGYTFGGHPVSAAVAMANLDVFEREGLVQHVHENAPGSARRSRSLLDLPIVGDVRGEGYFYGIEPGEGQADPRDLRRRRGRAAAARLPVEGAVRRRPVLPRRRPRRPGGAGSRRR